MADSIPRCPHCRTRLFQKSLDGKVKLRTSILVWNGTDAPIAKCPKCKADAPVDVQLGDKLQKALDTPDRKLLVRKGRNLLDSDDSRP